MAANRVKTIRYFFNTSTSDLATNTTLGTATRLNFASINLGIPENTSRSFLSVTLRMSFRDHFTVANEITGVRMGIQLGAAAVSDTDRSFTQANTGDHLYDEWTLDVTSYFNTNYGSGTTQTCVAALAVSTTAASNIGGNITAELIITYQYDDTAGSTRVKTIGIPLGSHAGSLTTTQTEIGSDGTNPPPTGQIPALATLLKEASVSIQQAAIIIEGTDGNIAGTVDLNPAVQIDATTEVLRGVVGQALTTSMIYRDIFIYDTTTFSTASTHTLKMRDTTTTGKFNCIGAILWVTYTYDKSTTTRQLNQAYIPLTQGDSEQGALNSSISWTTNIAADAETLFGVLDVQEPGTITLEQSALILRIGQFSNGGGFVVSANTQSGRTYSPPGGIGGELVVNHRIDCNTGAVTFTRGENRFYFSAYNTAGPNRVSINWPMALILYSSDVPSVGTGTGNRVVHFHNAAYGTSGSAIADIAASGAGQIAPVLFSPWKLNSYTLGGSARLGTGFGSQVALFKNGGEWDGKGFALSYLQRNSQAELASWRFEFPFTRLFNDHSFMTGKMDPTATHRIMSISAGLFAAYTWLTIHNVTSTLSGTLTIDGSPAADGKTIEIWAYKTSNPSFAERVTTAVTAGGAGGYTCQVIDNTRTYFATHTNNPDFGKSKSGTPGTGFDIAVRGGGSSDITDPSIVTISQPATSSDPLVVSVGDTSGLSMYQVTCKDRPDGARLTVYSPVDGGFVHPFGGKSTVTGSGTLADPYVFTIYRRGRWPTGLALDVRVQAVDTAGNEVDA